MEILTALEDSVIITHSSGGVYFLVIATNTPHFSATCAAKLKISAENGTARPV